MTIYAAGAIASALAGSLVTDVTDASLVPATAVLALAPALALPIVGVRTHMLTSPLILLGVPLLLSLAAAMQPITRIFGDWSLETLTAAILIVVAPLAGVGAAMLAAPGRLPRLERGTAATPHPQRLIAVCLLMCVAGTAVYANEWSGIGGPPLLSSEIDKARFSVDFGLLHVLTQGIPLALLIATWARVGRADSFTAPQRRMLEAVMCFVPIIVVLNGGRGPVLLPLLTAVVVAARYVSPHAARRMALVAPVAILVFSSAIFIARIEQQSTTAVGRTVLYNDTGTKSPPLQSGYRVSSIGLGEQLRVVAELRDAKVESPPFTSSIWFAHNFLGRAVDPQTITGPTAGGWLTATYAGPLLLDFGLIPALLFGFALGAGAHVLYRRFARGRSVTIIWVYAYLAGPIAFAFYVNVFLQFIYPFLDVIALITLSRLLIVGGGEGNHQQGESVAAGGEPDVLVGEKLIAVESAELVVR